MLKFRVSHLAALSILAMASLAQGGSLTVTASGASAVVSLNGNGINDGFVFSPTISADTSNYNLKAAALSAGWNGTTKLTVNITVNSGVVVSANSTGAYAFDTGAGFPAGSTITLTNKGHIVGMGGAGGTLYFDGTPDTVRSGGPALRAQYAMSVANTGTIGGGGGGGEGCGGGGGGGRTGRTNSSGGYGSGNGGQGTFGAAGLSGGNGGAGGDFGASGSLSACNFGRVGSGGAAVVGNANVTWTAIGTRLGAIN